jgi:TRAP transporter 4TM/12TM fusion protein
MQRSEMNQTQENLIDEEKEGAVKRNLQGTFWGKALVIFAVSMSIFQFSIAGIGGMTPLLLRAIHLAFASTLIFLIYPARRGSPRRRITFLDGAGIILSWITAIYLIHSFDDLAARAGDPSRSDVLWGVVAILLVLEITRRTTDWMMTLLGAGVIFYAYVGPWLPGLLAHRGFDMEKIASFMYTTTDGLYGITLGVSATYIFFFILFGAFLESMGAGKFFIDFAYSIVGRRKGGAAHTVVLANGLMSMISGVPAADVVTIGAFTFPLLNKLRYDRIFTSALSAVASTGAMITPPVMGSAAFLMAEMTGIPYRDICFSSLIPAALYYISLFAITHFYANRHNLVGVTPDQLPKTKTVLREGWFYAIPIFALIYFLIVEGFSPMFSGFYSIWSLLGVVFMMALGRKDTAEKLKRFGTNIFKALKSAALGALPVVAVCAVSGFLVGVLNLTGLGLKFSSIMMEWSQGNLFLALILCAGASMILGLGLPVAACYVILAILVGPALVKMGLTPMAAHLFILFYGAFAVITPPVAIAAFAAAAVNRVDPMKVGWYACWLAMVAFVIPFMFAYGPPLLMQGPTLEIIWAFLTGTVGVIAMASSLMGWLIGPANIGQRLLLFAGALLLIIPGIITDMVGAALLGLVFAWQKMRPVRAEFG